MPGRGLVLDIPQIEGGTMVLSDCADRIDVLPIVEWKDFSDAWKYLAREKHDYKWVAIDTITAAQELAKRKTIHERDLAADPHTVSMQDWGKIGELDCELIYRFKLLPLHLIVLAQERLRGSSEEGTLEYQPDISPKGLSGLTPSMFLIGRLYTREVGADKDIYVERRLRVGPHATTVTKVRALRTRQPPAVIREPNLGQILAYLLGQEVPIPEAVVEESSTMSLELV